MIKWRRFLRILKRLNVISVNSEYCVNRVHCLICSRFIYYKDVLFKNYDFRFSDVKKSQFWHLNSISYVLIVSTMFLCFSNDKMVQWQSLGYSYKFGDHSQHVIRCFLLHHAVFCLANVNINTLPAYFYSIWKISFPKKACSDVSMFILSCMFTSEPKSTALSDVCRLFTTIVYLAIQ